MNFVANLPHIKCYVRKEYLRDLEDGHGEFVDATIIAVKSIQGRALYFEAYLPEYGACFDKFPLSAFVWKKDIVESEQLPLDVLESKIDNWIEEISECMFESLNVAWFQNECLNVRVFGCLEV